MSFARVARRNLHVPVHLHAFTPSISTLSAPRSERTPESSSWWKFGSALAAGALGLYGGHTYNKRTAKACGIIGYVGEDAAVDFLVEGLRILQNRGYDSAGIASIDEPNDSITVTKYASKGSTSDSLDLVCAEAAETHTGHTCGIAHTRWATHGAKTDENAHPHADYGNRIALVHNGTIENCAELKRDLVAKGIPFHSQTDTEVIANLVGVYLDEGLDPRSALDKALSVCEGSWGIAMVCRDKPGEIIAARHGSPLMLGIGEGANFVASEHTAFVRHTNNFITLKEGEIAVISKDYVSVEDQHTRVQQAPSEEIETSPAPYDHWTLKEIMEQPQAVSRSLGYGSRLSFDNTVKLGGLSARADLLTGINNLIISGCGTSLHSGLYAQRLLQYLHTLDTVQVIDAAEVIGDSISATKEAGLLAISQSGETKDLLMCIEMAEKIGIPRFSVVNCVGSAIARETGLGVYTYAGREHAVASTKAFLTQVTVLALIALWFLQNRGDGDPQRAERLIEAIHRLPTYVGMSLSLQEQCEKIGRNLIAAGAEHMFVLGKGFAESIAYEGALKIKEISYVHAEGYSGGALKHGPFALIEDGTPIVMIILDDEHAKVMVTNAHEVESRGAKCIYITDKPSLCAELKGEVIKIPSNGPLTALLAVIPMQCIAYYMSVAKGINPDKPKNLAKAVTVV